MNEKIFKTTEEIAEYWKKDSSESKYIQRILEWDEELDETRIEKECFERIVVTFSVVTIGWHE